MNFDYLSPYVRIAMDSIIEPPWKLSERVIFDYELLYIKEGKVKISIEDVEYDGRPGDIFLFRPKVRHSIELQGDERFRQPHIHFDLFYRQDSPEVKVSFKTLDKMSVDEIRFFREDITLEAEIRLPDKLSVRNIKYFEEMIFEIIDEYQSRMPLYHMNVKGLFIKLWAFLIKENNYTGNSEVMQRIEDLKHLKEYLKTNADKDIFLDALSKEFAISKYHLVRLFKRAFGMTPMHYHQLMRIEKAKEMVQFSSESLTAISERLGFNSINSFSRSFRSAYGVPPSFYRGKG